MAKGKRYFWLRMEEDFLDNRDIRRLRARAGGADYVICYLKLILRTIRSSGVIEIMADDDIVSEVAVIIDEPRDNVSAVLAYLQKYDMIQITEMNSVIVNYTKDHVGSECESAPRVRAHREREKKEALQCNNNVTPSDAKCNTEQQQQQQQQKQQQKQQQQQQHEDNDSATTVVDDVEEEATELGDEEQAVLDILVAKPWDIPEGRAAELIMAHGAARCSGFEKKYRARALRGEVRTGLLIRLIQDPNEPTPTIKPAPAKKYEDRCYEDDAGRSFIREV